MRTSIVLTREPVPRGDPRNAPEGDWQGRAGEREPRELGRSQFPSASDQPRQNKIKAPPDVPRGATSYPDQDQSQTWLDPNNEDDATRSVRHFTLRLLAPRVNFRATFEVVLSQPRESNVERWTRPDSDGHRTVLGTGALPVELRAHCSAF